MSSAAQAIGSGGARVGMDPDRESWMKLRLKHWVSSLVGRRRHHFSVARSDAHRSSHAPKWWKIRLFYGIATDLRRRGPYYWSDWKDAWDYRVVPATVYMYFANILPALAFSLDMFTKTDMQYGVNEVLLASVLGAVVFSVLACQPLVIVGVTGPITVFNYTVYDIMSPTGTNYLAFMCWIGMFPCDIFGFYIAFIYLQKGIQVLERLGSEEPFYLSICVSLLVFLVAYVCGDLGRSSLFNHKVRVFLKDYGTPLTVIFFTGFVYIGRMKSVPLERLPTSTAFFPTSDRSWLVDFWNISVVDVFLALPFALLLTILFWFDHNVSSLIAQGTEFPLSKPAGFHWDLFLLGLTTGVAGILGLPFPNGLIPQAPFHTESLCVTTLVADPDESGGSKGHYVLRPTHVVEQRVSNLAQGLLTLGTMTGPLLVVLHLIPQGVLAGLFFIMGIQALESNGITAKILFLARDASTMNPSSSSSSSPSGGGGAAHPLKRLQRRRAVWFFVALELLGFAATFAITQTVAAVGFPVFILLLIPARATLLPRWFTPAELAVLDAPTAGPLTMESVGGSYGGSSGDDGDGDDGGSGSGSGSGGEPYFPSGPLQQSGGGVLEGRYGPSGSGDESGDGPGFRAKGGLSRKSEEELAELGESRAGVTRRRGSAVGRSEGDAVEMLRLGVNRRSGGQTARGGA